MGQNASATKTQAIYKQTLPKSRIKELFQTRALQTLSARELASIASKLNIASFNDSHVVTLTDLAYLLQLSNDKEKDVSSIHEDFACVVRILYDSLTILGNLPFLGDSLEADNNSQLTLKSLIVASAVHTGRINSFWNNAEYLKLLFISLSFPPTKQSSEKAAEKWEQVIENSAELSFRTVPDEKDSSAQIALKIKWADFEHLTTYDDLDVECLRVPADNMVKLITLLLLVRSVRLQSHDKMQFLLQERIEKCWNKFEGAALSLVRFMNVDVNASNMNSKCITYEQFNSGVVNGFLNLFTDVFKRLFENGFLGSIVADPKAPPSHSLNENTEATATEKESKATADKKQERIKKAYNFEETRLVNDASLALIATALQASGINEEISRETVVELYNGAHAGFSIRSLESKIFKWQAPTIFLISGKRLRSKTIAQNKRYQQFEDMFPRFFRSTENPRKAWQTDSDKITYAVYVEEPWRNSNKSNFGNELTTIVNLSPRYDIYTSKHDPVIKGMSVYFNNLGMGIGFGNDQPINKNNVRRIIPGKVSLTVEANLEFAVFRHIFNSSANTSAFFNFSRQGAARNEDYEDRFMITDLEVWGIGSTKELEEQKKQWEWEEKQAQARQSVNVGTLSEDRALLEMAGLIGNHGSGGSV
ncbi:putative restriction of telomere capping protein [Clavispora lusitaniae]|uniref:Restriction of telomere capping protein n=1 Tax=Clavispora lusitaniae TaxID=36911 RepID=A0AA91Q441_CLALS|nr:putative restriction of telomere capping protein [Clavispora lusitaniae]